jgi:beta-galactosidase
MSRFISFFAPIILLTAAALAADPPRERLLMDANWRFAPGHATDVRKDFDHATGDFSHFAKTGFGSGASAPQFDDSGWRKLDLPHDWAVELPFSERGSKSHGHKAIGRNFPENSVGWYRRKFTVPASDLGRRVSIQFDGVFRDSIVWINGHYLGTEESGYSGFSRNLTEFLNYGGENIITVRVDASLEEGWFYEGAGIYRHVWLVKTAPLHVEENGTSATSELKDRAAEVTARVAVVNEGTEAATFDIEQAILDGSGKTIATAQSKQLKSRRAVGVSSAKCCPYPTQSSGPSKLHISTSSSRSSFPAARWWIAMRPPSASAQSVSMRTRDSSSMAST